MVDQAPRPLALPPGLADRVLRPGRNLGFAGGTNLDPAKDMHMHSAILTFVDDDHIEMAGEAWVDGKPSETHCGTMKLVRKK